MILYKYLSFSVGMQAIAKNTVRFTPPSQLNDPFETSASQYFPFMLQRIANDYYGILSLSRSPINPVIWSHYGHGPQLGTQKSIPVFKSSAHRGIVIGIDADIAGFNDIETCVLPASLGNIIYTNTKPPIKVKENNLTWNLENGRIQRYIPELLEQVQQKFLYKSIGWSYEEEVRVIKALVSEEFRNEYQGRRHKLNGILTLPPNSIKEVYFGCTHFRSAALFRRIQRLRLFQPEATFYCLGMNNDDWGLSKILINKDEPIPNFDSIAINKG